MKKRGHRVAWSILVALGAMDPGSNPGGPIYNTLVSVAYADTRNSKAKCLMLNKDAWLF